MNWHVSCGKTNILPPSVQRLSSDRVVFFWNPGDKQLQKIIDHVLCFNEFQSRLSDMFLSSPAEPRTICPIHPWLPHRRDNSAYQSMRPDILKQPNGSAYHHNSMKLS